MARKVALGSWLLLLALLTLMIQQVSAPDSNRVSLWLFQCLPLLLFLPGLWQARKRTHFWLCFIAMFYFIQGVLMALQPAYRAWGFGEALLSVTLFCSALLYVRWATPDENLSKE